MALLDFLFGGPWIYPRLAVQMMAAQSMTLRRNLEMHQARR